MTSNAGFTNVSVQKFASEGDLALFERNWSEHRDLVLGKLGAKGLVGFTAHQFGTRMKTLPVCIFSNMRAQKLLKPAFPSGRSLRLPFLEASR